MNQLVFIENNQPVTDSLTVAQMFGKEHKNVMRDINTQMEYAGEEFGRLNFELISYTDSMNRTQPKYNLTEEAFTLVVFSYNTKEAVQTKIKFIQEFKRMRAFIEQQQPSDPVELALQTALKHQQAIKNIETDVAFLKENMRIDGAQEYALNSQGKAKVLEVLGGYNSAAYSAIGKKAFAQLWRDFKRHFQLPRYSELPKTKFDEAVYFISKWRPNTSLEIEIENLNKQTRLQLVK